MSRTAEIPVPAAGRARHLGRSALRGPRWRHAGAIADDALLLVAGFVRASSSAPRSPHRPFLNHPSRPGAAGPRRKAD